MAFNIDPDVQAFIAKVEEHFSYDSAAQDIAEQRRRYDALCAAFDRPRPDDMAVTEGEIAGRDGATIAIRSYRPAQATGAGLVYAHGGGWSVGGLDSHDGICVDLAARTGTTVIAVDYRLAPEYPCPVAHEDTWDAVTAIAADAVAFGIDPGRLGVGGDSAGANIMAGVCVRARDRGGPSIAAQILIYGAFGGDWSLPSYTQMAEAPMLTTADMKAYHRLYAGADDLPDDPFIAPLRSDDLSGLPPAFLQPVGLDPLRDESVAYAARLRDAGVPVDLVIEEGLPHGALRARHSTVRGAASFDRLCTAVSRMLA